MIQVRIAKAFAPGEDSAGFQLNVEFEAGPGVTVLFGPSGSGKTLTLDAVAGLATPDAGRILLNDRILFDSGAHVNVPPRHRRCGYVFQSYALFPHMTLRENLAFAADNIPRLERHRKIAEMLERFQLGDLGGRYPRELSGGQKQRGSLARALITEPEILLLDEPARGLDQELRQDLYGLIQGLKSSLPVPVLMVTHEVEELFGIADSVFVFEPGKIIRQGAPAELLRNPGTEAVARLLGDFCVFQAEILGLDPGRQTSRLRVLEEELQGLYYPGCFLGDRIRVCLRPEELLVHTNPGQNRVRRKALRWRERPQTIRVDFGDGIEADVPREQWKQIAGAEALWVEFPAPAFRRLA